MPEKTNNPKITVIIPTFKRPQLLKRAINSVLCQTFTDFKVCVYDNASGDETQRVVDEIAKRDGRVLYHCHENNIGVAKNFHYGLMRVETPFFSFLSDDDFLLPNFLETAMRGFARYPEAAFSAASVITMTDKGKILYEPLSLWKMEGLFHPPEGLLETIGEKYPIWTGILFRREVIGLTGGIDEELLGSGDLDFVHRIAVKAPFVVSKEPVAVCVNHETSSSAVAALSAYWPSWLKMIRNITDDKDIPEPVKDKFRYAMEAQIAGRIFWIGVRSLEMKNFDQAEKAAKIVSEELNQETKGLLLAWSIKQARRSQPLWFAAAAVIRFRRKMTSLINIKRIRLQKKHGHLAARLKFE